MIINNENKIYQEIEKEKMKEKLNWMVKRNHY